MNRNRTMLLVLALGSAMLANAQCEVKKDAFNGETRITASQYLYPVLPFNGYHMLRSGGGCTLSLCFSYGGVVEKKWPASGEVKLKLGNSEIVTLTNINEATPVSSNASGVVFTRYMVEFPLDMATLQKLGASAITDIRYPNLLQGGVADIDLAAHKVYRKTAAKLAKSATCVIKGG